MPKYLILGTSSAASSPLKKEQPLFTLRQVGMICERLLKEREEKIREEYEEILTTKLAGILQFRIICRSEFESLKLLLFLLQCMFFSDLIW